MSVKFSLSMIKDHTLLQKAPTAFHYWHKFYTSW